MVWSRKQTQVYGGVISSLQGALVSHNKHKYIGGVGPNMLFKEWSGLVQQTQVYRWCKMFSTGCSSIAAQQTQVYRWCNNYALYRVVWSRQQTQVYRWCNMLFTGWSFLGQQTQIDWWYSLLDKERCDPDHTMCRFNTKLKRIFCPSRQICVGHCSSHDKDFKVLS